MNNRRIIAVFCIVAFVSVALAFEGKTQLTRKTLGLAQTNKSETILSAKQTTVFAPTPQRKSELTSASQKAEVPPEYILYDQVFSLIVIFKKKAEEQEAKGEAVTQFRSYFKDEAKLTAQEDDFLTQTANNFNQEVRILDAQAEVIIEQLRQQFPIGSLPEGQLIQPSPELLQLQEQRNKLALHHRNQLRDLLGEDKFNEFDNFVKGKFASGFRAMPLSSLPNSQDQGGKK